MNIKSWLKNVWLGVVKKCMWPHWSQDSWLYFKNKLMEQTDVLHADANSEKLKVPRLLVNLVKNGRDLIGHGTLKYVLLQE